VQIVRGLLTTDGFSFEGRYYSTDHATLHPRPVQSPHPPIWIGAAGERRMMPIAARWADVWHSYGPPDMMREKSARLSRMALEGGRDPVEITRASSLSLEDDPDTIARLVEAWEDAGFEYLVCGWPSGGRAQIAAFASRFLCD
jgi:alkanesulfonate monooxygenase SsuD/methylene tetrahydromethanopterin reductase-like flavin-dependent oxidoreductase (luciferase family)